MAGIYIHIPYCKTICHYCDFYKTANLKNVDQFIDSIIKEIELKKELISNKISTIYFGGGTPSVLVFLQIKKILDKIKDAYFLEINPEITIEVNPDDANLELLKDLKDIGFNRISIGIQSFNDSILSFLNRRHNAKVAINSVENSIEAGFDSISVDLIYGIPNQRAGDLIVDLELIKSLNIQHLSAYHLGIEENSYFGKLKNKGRFSEIDEVMSKSFYDLLINWSLKNNFDHYEVSNFAKNGKISNHNKAYWFSIPYYGFGPSAHSYYGNKRSFNLSNVNFYINAIQNGKKCYDEEILTSTNRYNEYIMLRSRTKWGLNLLKIKKMVNTEIYNNIIRIIRQFCDSNYLRIKNDQVILTENGFFISDYIIKDLIISE